MSYDEKTVGRVRRILSKENDAVEIKMMGGMCFMVRGNMCCGVWETALMVRVGPDAYQQVLTQPHVRPMEFAGRRPTGFVLVDPEGYRGSAALAIWIQRGLDFIVTLPSKKAKKPTAKRANAMRPRKAH